jgi:hypothetical protein
MNQTHKSLTRISKSIHLKYPFESTISIHASPSRIQTRGLEKGKREKSKGIGGRVPW